MRARNLTVNILFLWALAGTVILAVSNESIAQSMGRTNRSEVYGIWQMMGGDKSNFGSVYIDFDDSNLFGLGLGYNIDEHINVNTDFLFGSADYVAGDDDVNFTDDVRIVGWDVNLDYNFMEGSLTPLVTGGIGFMNFSGDLGFSETDFSYNLGAGVRWDISDNMFLKALYRFTWVKLKDADSAMLMDGAQVAFGFTF